MRNRKRGEERFPVPAEERENMAAEDQPPPLGLAIAVFTPPHHKSDQERDEADGSDDHG